MNHAQCCPICMGRGQVSIGFYNTQDGQWSTSTLNTEICRSCNGTGWVTVQDQTDYLPVEEKK